MAMIGGERRRFAKGEMEKLRAGNLVSDRETQAFEDAAREQAQQSIQAQQKIMNRAAAANKAGSPVVAGALKSASQDVARQNADAAIKATGQAQKFSEALREQRKASTLNLAQTQIAQNRADMGMALDAAGSMAGLMTDFQK